MTYSFGLMRLKQQSFLPSLKINMALDHGGDVRKGKRKLSRPFDPNRPLHIVMRASKARGQFSMLTPKNKVLVKQFLDRIAKQYRIKIYRFQNVGNHLHILLKTEAKQFMLAREDLAAFLRRFSGAVAMKVAGGKKGASFGRFWDRLVYSRIVSWGKEFEILSDYFMKNFFETLGARDYWDHLKRIEKTFERPRPG